MRKNDLLELIFLTDTGRTVTISVRKPLPGLTAEQIKAAMDGMVATGAYESKSGRLKAPYSFIMNTIGVTKLV